MHEQLDSFDQMNGAAIPTGSRFTAGLIVGALAGAAAALLLTPTTGRKLRRQLYNGAGNMASKAREWYRTARTEVNDVANDTIATAREARARAREAVSSR